MKEALALVNSPSAVAKHSFFPFIVDNRSYRPYRNPSSSRGAESVKQGLKVRQIRSAARRDAAIYSAYRQILSKKYESLLSLRGLTSDVIGYRRIRKQGAVGGKCNIDHAFDVFEFIRCQEKCVSVTLDVSQFFESIDHAKLKAAWANILGVASLPKDHFQVFKNITRYSWIERQDLYKDLELVKEVNFPGGVVEVPLRKVDKMQLCTSQEFKALIRDSEGKLRLLNQNKQGFGIPQGSPLSDLLANMYLLEFDTEISALVASKNGIYRRYSDDILIVVPGGLREGRQIQKDVQEKIGQHGSEIKIKTEKCAVVAFERRRHGMRCTASKLNTRKIQSLEYLGFRFDGQSVHLRDNTVSRYQRKVRKFTKKMAKEHVLSNPAKNMKELLDSAPHQRICEKVGRLKPRKREGYKNQTFHSYTKRAERVFGERLTNKFHNRIAYKRWISRDLPELIVRYKKQLQQKQI